MIPRCDLVRWGSKPNVAVSVYGSKTPKADRVIHFEQVHRKWSMQLIRTAPARDLQASALATAFAAAAE